MRELMGLAVERAGAAVREAEHGQDALEQVAGDLPSLILLDLRMPVMDGWTFARLFRERYGTRVPILLVTGLEDAQDQAEALGVQGWVDKPFTITEFVRTVQAHLPATGSPAATAA
jgi:CheY-like chemotaxis protein